MSDKYIEWEDFKKVEIKTGTIVEVLDFPEAIKPAYKIKVDLGSKVGIKNSSAQITTIYTKEQLLGKQVLVVTNLRPKQIGPYVSECLITGFYENDTDVVLSTCDRKLENGLLLS